jgi:hypothetical protein
MEERALQTLPTKRIDRGRRASSGRLSEAAGAGALRVLAVLTLYCIAWHPQVMVASTSALFIGVADFTPSPILVGLHLGAVVAASFMQISGQTLSPTV